MSDKMRGALFTILGDITGLSTLDAFGGTGALGFEAVSRGASGAIIIEQDRTAQRAIAQNIDKLGLNKYVKLSKGTARTWLHANPDAQFDLVLLDPPYDDLQPELLAELAKLVTKDGIVIVSHPATAPAPEFVGLSQVKQRSYGDAQLLFYSA
jgi:16S rRNA (guanine966-N2)-methyltransferase